ncbi:unnamed protein product [Leptidea sinapis]|uniref:BPTI/Kunitz inhibitor domain-containing protein n=1 Tax=Leptidea sinapis TaxID=189913 RepID=A0A5E4QYY7_9NEOP|nr:unnamed protein product [Leptidea sinapis]
MGSCGTHTWGPWGPCSVTCGTGRSARQRNYMWPSRANADGCRVALTEFKSCNGPRMNCRVQSEYEPDPAESSGPCAVSPWSEWSPCEGCGVRARTRHYIVPRAHKRCSVGFRARTDNPHGDCPVTPWSSWSPCSARCGRGKRIRTRIYVTRDSRVQHLLWQELSAENITSDNPNVELLAAEHIERCQFTLTRQEALCDGDDESCEVISDEVCKLPLSVGPCRGYQERWFYDTSRGVCEPFGYTGCGGNGNNFRNRDTCNRVCGNLKSSTGNDVMLNDVPSSPTLNDRPKSE